MRKLMVGALVLSIAAPVFSQVYVPGYVRRDGTYVQPHYRSAPDRNPYNNYSAPGNYNPYTGRRGTGDQDSYGTRRGGDLGGHGPKIDPYNIYPD